MSSAVRRGVTHEGDAGISNPGLNTHAQYAKLGVAPIYRTNASIECGVAALLDVENTSIPIFPL